MTFGKGIVFAHKEALAFLVACPLIALIPFVAEMIQHIAEMQIGMYDSVEGFQAAAANPLRMGLGFVKTVAISLMGYPIIRFIAGQRDAAAARKIDAEAVRLFIPVLLFDAAIAGLDLFVLRGTPILSGIFFAFNILVLPLLLRWKVGAVLSISVNPAQSAAEMFRSMPWVIAFSIAVFLPLMALHQGLASVALLAPAVAKWPVLIADSAVTALLVAVIMAGGWVAANRPGTLSTTVAN